MTAKRYVLPSVVLVAVLGLIVWILVTRSGPITIVAQDLGTVELGDQLQVDYVVPAGNALNSAVIEIKNNPASGEVLIYRSSIPFTDGRHSVTWDVKWNQGSKEKGAYANPRRGPYTIQITGTSRWRTHASTRSVVNTRFVVDVDLEDDKPSPDEISSGIDPAILDPANGNPFRVGVAHGESPVANETFTWATARPEFLNVVRANLDNYPDNGDEIKSVQVRQVIPSTLPDGVYRVVIKNLRDEAGNVGPGGEDGIINDWKVRLY